MSQFGHGQKKSYHGLPGKRIPDHVEFDAQNEHHVGHSPIHHHSHHVGDHHLGGHHHHHNEEHEYGPVEHDVPFVQHGIEETHVKGKGYGHNHVSVYGGFHHNGYR